MGGRFLTDLFSDDNDNEGDGKDAIPLNSYKALFEKLCPMYMSMGMTYDEFWHGDPTLAVAYREAYLAKRRQVNHDLWLQGRYVYDALCAVYPLFRFSFKGGEIKAERYVEEPYPLTAKEAKQREEEKRKREYEENIKMWRERTKVKKSATEEKDG